MDPNKQYNQSDLPSDIFNSTNGDVKSYNGQQVTVGVNSNGTRSLTPVSGGGGLSQPQSSGDVQGYLNDYHNLTLKAAQLADQPQQSDQQIMDQVKQNLLPNTPVPQLPSLSGTYQSLIGDPNITSLESKLSALKQQENTIKTQTIASQSVEDGKPVAQNVIQGRQSEEQRQADMQLSSLALQKAAVVDELTQRYTMIDNIMKYTQQDYTNAVQNYQMQFQQASTIWDAFEKAKNDQTANEQQALSTAINATGKMADLAMQQQQFNYQMQQDQIKNASANLTIMANMITNGNLTYGQLSPDQKLNIQKLEVQAGLGTGFLENLTRNDPNGKVIYAGESGAVMQLPDGTLKTLNYNVGPATKLSDTEKQQADSGKVSQYLSANTNSYGNVSPAAWKTALAAWNKDGYKTADFVSNFSQLTDPNRGDFVNAYGFNPKLRGGVDSTAASTSKPAADNSVASFVKKK